MNRRSPRLVKGKVISDKMNKTRVIRVRRVVPHAFYGKTIIKFTKIYVHDEKNESKVGDIVVASSTRPISKNTHFRLKTVEKVASV